MVSAKRRPSPKSHFVHEWCVPGRDESLYSSELSNVNDGSGNYNRATTTGCGFDDREDNHVTLMFRQIKLTMEEYVCLKVITMLNQGRVLSS
jgi:hypothetical protein